METTHLFLKNCFLLKTNHYDALELLANKKGKELLEFGENLALNYKHIEEENKKYVYAYTEFEGKKKMIGILSEEDAAYLIPYLKMGWGDKLFECRISKYDEKADEDKRFSIVIYIRKNKNQNEEE